MGKRKGPVSGIRPFVHCSKRTGAPNKDPGPAPLLFRLSPVFPAQRSALIPICQFVSTVPADAYNCFL